jgi:hypothetical protein
MPSYPARGLRRVALRSPKSGHLLFFTPRGSPICPERGSYRALGQTLRSCRLSRGDDEPDGRSLRGICRWRCGSRAAGRIRWLRRRRSTGEIDLVTAIDRASEKAILAIIGRAFPGHGFLAEESDPRSGDGEHLWVVDPLDGTTNYSRGFPYFCASVALARAGRVVVAAVYQPLLGELFTAIRGQGAFLNGRRLRSPCRRASSRRYWPRGFRTISAAGAAPTSTTSPISRRAAWRSAGRRRRSIWPTSPPDASTASGSSNCALGHRRRLAAGRGGWRPDHRAGGPPTASRPRRGASNGWIHRGAGGPQ